MAQTGPRYLTQTDLGTLTTSQLDELGSVGQTSDGRYYRYVKFGGTSTINPGLLLVAAALPANSTALAITAAGTGGQVAANLVAGSYSFVVTNGGTAVTQDEFAEGFVEVIGTSTVQTYQIRGNTKAAATTGFITLYLTEPLRTTVVTVTNTVNLTKSIFDSPAASLTQAMPVGVTSVAVPNTATVTNYGWVQTRGHAFLSATSGTKGFPVTQDLAGTAGFVAVTGAGAAETVPQIGIFKESAASSTAPVELMLW